MPSALSRLYLQKSFGSVPATPILLKNLSRTCEFVFLFLEEIVGRRICAVILIVHVYEEVVENMDTRDGMLGGGVEEDVADASKNLI